MGDTLSTKVSIPFVVLGRFYVVLWLYLRETRIPHAIKMAHIWLIVSMLRRLLVLWQEP